MSSETIDIAHAVERMKMKGRYTHLFAFGSALLPEPEWSPVLAPRGGNTLLLRLGVCVFAPWHPHDGQFQIPSWEGRLCFLETWPPNLTRTTSTPVDRRGACVYCTPPGASLDAGILSDTRMWTLA